MVHNVSGRGGGLAERARERSVSTAPCYAATATGYEATDPASRSVTRRPRVRSGDLHAPTENKYKLHVSDYC